jgi:arylsulfatase A-like enzyme/formylglycine-generating enzyme required for sulfatase activity
MTESEDQKVDVLEPGVPKAARSPGSPPHPDMVWVPGGTFRMGSENHYPEERPVHRVTVDGYWIDRYPVTNEHFRRFVEATRYVTFAEIPPDPAQYPGAKPDMLYAGSLVFVKPRGPVDLRDFSNWWTFMRAADWRHPQGPKSSLGGRKRHPVVHVAYRDAEAYAKWAGKELPSEAEWEFAAQGGLDGAEFAWGDEFTPRGRMMANTWQGEFPWQNLLGLPEGQQAGGQPGSVVASKDRARERRGAVAEVPKRPNILVIWGDDIGITNLSCYSDGLMGYSTPNVDRIAREGMRFTDSYGEQSCTAGRAAFITGQSVFRTGLSKVGIPAAPVGLQAEDPTIAELLKNHGYATGQFGKNHLGDLNKYLPTAHGFDEFFGNLYHLNAEEEPEMPDYPPAKDFPKFRERFGPRGVLHCWATDKDDPTEQPRWGRVGKQKIEDTGPLTRKRMETCDDEFVAAAQDWIRRQHGAGTPWFCWVNTTHMHLFTHTKTASLGQAGRWQSPYHDTMIDHDKNVGELLDLLDELGIANDTFVMYSTDNGPHMNTWPDGAMTPFRSEKNTNWEGAFRVPLLVRWPGRIPAGVVLNEIVQHHDWLPTFLAMAGEPDVKEKLLRGHQAAGKTFKTHLDGYNLLPYLTGQEKKSPRQGFIYFNDDGDLVALRFDNWKVVFMEQRVSGTMRVWAEPFVPLRVPKLYNLRTDPFERADVTSNTYYDWFIYHGYMVLAAQTIVADFLATFKEFPPRQKAASFTIDQAMEKMNAAASGAGH